MASMVLSPSSARKNVTPMARTAAARRWACRPVPPPPRRPSRVSPRHVHQANPRKARPATRFSPGSAGDADDLADRHRDGVGDRRRDRDADEHRDRRKAGRERERLSWDLSPSSATNTTPKLTANAIRTPSMWECSSRREMRPGPDAQPPHACGDARSHPSGRGRTGGLRSGTRGRTRSKVSLARPESGRAAGLAPVCRPQRWELLPLVRARIAGRPPTGRAGRGGSDTEVED